MNTHYLSAVALVDDEGHLFSSISATDLRNISFNLADEFSLKALALPAQEFIDLSRKVRGQVSAARSLKPFTDTCHSNKTSSCGASLARHCAM